MKIDIEKHLIKTARTHRAMGDPLTIEDLASLALDIQTKNIEARRMHDELIFVGYTNGAQIFYASDETVGGGEGMFFKTHEHGCHIPLYMLKTHQHRIETTTEGEVTIDLIKAAQKR